MRAFFWWLFFWLTEMITVFLMICATSFLIFAVLSMANKLFEVL